MKCFLSIIVPLYNEKESVDLLVERICKAIEHQGLSYEIILVDDGSTDGTWASVVKLKSKFTVIRGIKFRKNF
jgi:glycosyltransferase involved in cell wall biosynthesis